jgi:uncharacterized protein (TIGR00369 family)
MTVERDGEGIVHDEDGPAAAVEQPQAAAPPPEEDAGLTLQRLMPHALEIGVRLTEASAEQARGELAWAPERCTAGGIMHGGAMMTLGDTVGAACAFLNLPPGAATATIESKTNFLRGVREGTVHATARPIHVGRSVIVVQTDLSDADGRPVALMIQTQAVIEARA